MDYDYGHENQLHQRVTIVHHSRNTRYKVTLPAGACQLPPFEGDPLCEREEFSDASGKRIALFTIEDYRRLRRPGVPPLLLISRTGVSLASREHLEKMERWAQGPLPSKPVPFSGGDGSSIEKAIIVHTRDKLDGKLAMYEYMRVRFGWMRTYKGAGGGWIPIGDKLYDLCEFVTPDGKKHVLYFDMTEFWPPERKASNQSLQRTAGRSDVPRNIMKTRPLQATLAATSGR